MPEKYKRGAKNFEGYTFTRKSASEQMADLIQEKAEDKTIPVLGEDVSSSSDSSVSSEAKSKRGRKKKARTQEEIERDNALVSKGAGSVGKTIIDFRKDVSGKTEEELKAFLAEEENKSQARAYKNRKSRAEGRTFEEAIERGCSFYFETGKANIVKVPENRKVVGRTGGRTSMMLCVNAQKSQPDFVGTLLGGKSIVFEAKHTDKGKMDYTKVTDYQREQLRRHQQFGAECYVAIGFSADYDEAGAKYASSFDFGDDPEVVFFVPFNVWENMQTLVGHKWFSLNDGRKGGILAQYRVKYSVEIDEKGNGIGTVYFLDKFSA